MTVNICLFSQPEQVAFVPCSIGIIPILSAVQSPEGQRTVSAKNQCSQHPQSTITVYTVYRTLVTEQSVAGFYAVDYKLPS